MRIRITVAVACTALAGSGWTLADDPPPGGAFDPPVLAPASAAVRNQCRLAQAGVRAPVLCPSVLPQASVAPTGAPAGSAPPVLKAWRARYIQRNGDMTRLTFRYGSDAAAASHFEGRAWRTRPCCSLHFEVFTRTHAPFRISGGRPQTVAGHRGLFFPAVGPDISCAQINDRLFWCNHVAFAWREHGVSYAATLRTFGAGTTELLAQLIAGLEPAPRHR